PYLVLRNLNDSLRRKNNRLESLVEKLKIETEHRKKVERANLRKRQILDRVLESTIDGILVIDNDKNLIHINSPFVKMMDIPDEIILNRDTKEIIKYIIGNSKDPLDFDTYLKEALN